MENGQPLTSLMRQASRGDAASAEQLYSLVYTDLHRIAQNRLRQERAGHTLQATALVNEAFIRLHRIENFDFQCRTHFFAIAANIMRRLLVDHARKHSQRGAAGVQVSLADAEHLARVGPPTITEVDELLTRLALLDARAARVVEMKYFAGMTDDEVAEALRVEKHVVRRDWDFAKAWFRQCLPGRAL
jgi:RNA polymerase sigma-70 factor, ECF subfamily